MPRRFSQDSPIKRYSPEEAFPRICRFCAYQERSHREVRDKLYTYGLFPSQVEELLTRVITEGYLNEDRFAKSLAGGKFRMQKWGRIKIANALEFHGVSPRCIKNGLREIDDASYKHTLKNLLTRKLGTLKNVEPFKARNQAARFVIGKGYEPDLVWETIRTLTP